MKILKLKSKQKKLKGFEVETQNLEDITMEEIQDSDDGNFCSLIWCEWYVMQKHKIEQENLKWS